LRNYSKGILATFVIHSLLFASSVGKEFMKHLCSTYSALALQPSPFQAFFQSCNYIWPKGTFYDYQ